MFLKNNIFANDEKGFALIIVLLILSLMTVIGIASTNTTDIELQIAGNEKLIVQNFYNAEAEAMKSAQYIYNIDDESILLAQNGNSISTANNNDITDSNQDIDNLDINNDGIINSDDVNATEKIVLLGVTSGNSLGLGSSRLYDYVAYGLSKQNNGIKAIAIGVKKRF